MVEWLQSSSLPTETCTFSYLPSFVPVRSDVEEGKQPSAHATSSEILAAQRQVLAVCMEHFGAFSAQTQAHMRHEENTINAVGTSEPIHTLYCFAVPREWN